jgi:hypothetical protein
MVARGLPVVEPGYALLSLINIREVAQADSQ